MRWLRHPEVTIIRSRSIAKACTAYNQPDINLMSINADSVLSVPKVSSVTVMARVVSALLLRDMRTRFGRTLFGWVVMIMWPLSHLAFLMLGYYLSHRIAPIGPNLTVFVGTGVLPYILCLYPARMIQTCIVQNQPLLLFPPVQIIDLLVARSILEMINAFWVVAIFCFVLFFLDVEFLPGDYAEAILAIAATIYLGVAIGMISAILYKLFRPWIAIQIGLLIVAYLSSGALVPLTSTPGWVRDVVWFNPLFHCVEWLRLAYYGASAQDMLNRAYLISYATALIFLTLVLQRAIRGALQQYN